MSTIREIVIGHLENKNVLILNNHFDITEFYKYLDGKDPIKFCKTLDNIVFFYPENIPFELLKLMDLLASNEIPFVCNSFCITLQNYFDTKYRPGLASFPTLSSANQGHFRRKLPWFDILKVKSKERKYRIKHFTNLRKINRDIAFDFLQKNGFCTEENLITFRGNNLTNFDEYKSYLTENCYKEFDYNSLNEIHYESETQKNLDPAKYKETADDLLFHSHENVMFDIVTESVHPWENSDREILQKISSVTKRIILPCLFKNVFHIYPKNKPLETWLVNNGFELFFNSDDDFLENCNKEFYLSNDVQKKLEKNYSLMLSLYFEELQSFLFQEC